MCNKPTAASQSLLLLKVLMALDISPSTPPISRPLPVFSTSISFGKAHWCKNRAWAGSHLSEQLTTLENANTTRENPENPESLATACCRQVAEQQGPAVLEEPCNALCDPSIFGRAFHYTTLKTQAMTPCSDHFA